MRRRLAVLCVFVAVVAGATIGLLHHGSDQPRTLAPGAGNSETTEDPLAWDPDRRAELERSLLDYAQTQNAIPLDVINEYLSAA